MLSRPVDPFVPGAIGGYDHAEDARKFGHYSLWGVLNAEASGTFQRESDDPDDYPAVTDEDMRHAAQGADGVRTDTPPLDPLKYETPLDSYYDVIDYDEAVRKQLGGTNQWASKVLYKAWKAAWQIRRGRVVSAKRHANWLAQGAAVFHPDGIDRAGNALTADSDLDGMLQDGVRASGSDTLFMNRKVFDWVRNHASITGKLPDNRSKILDEKDFISNYLARQTGAERVVVTDAHENPKRYTDYIFGDHVVFARTKMAGLGRDPLVARSANNFMLPVNCAGAVRLMRSVNYWSEAEMKVVHGAVLSDPARVPKPDARRRLAGFTFVAGEYRVRTNSADIGLLRAEEHKLLDRTRVFTLLNIFG